MKTSSVEAKVEYLRPSTLYRFRVMAWNSLGPSSHPAQVSIQTLTQGKNNNTCYSEIIVINLKSGGERQCGSRGTNHTNYIKYISDNYTVWWEESEECHRIVCLHTLFSDRHLVDSFTRNDSTENIYAPKLITPCVRKRNCKSADQWQSYLMTAVLRSPGDKSGELIAFQWFRWNAHI